MRVFSALPLFLLLVSSLLLVACSQKPKDDTLLNKVLNSKVLTVGVKFDSKPFGYLDTDGQVKGYEVDLIHELVHRLEIQERLPRDTIHVNFQQVLPATRMIGLSMGKLDLVAATMTVNAEREKIIDFSNSYYIAHQAILVPSKSSVRHLDQLKSGKILFVFGTTSEKNIKNTLPKASYKGYKSSMGAFMALKEGEGDALTNDDTVLYGEMDKNCRYRLLPEKISDEPYALGIRQDEDTHTTESFRIVINQILREMEADGSLDKLYQKWLAPYNQLNQCRVL